MFAGLTLMLICGAVGLAIDIGVWYRTARAMQNAADAAAVAAARDNGRGNAWSGTGQAVAARYGFVDGVDGISVQIANNQTCPNGTANCFKATIHDEAAPQFFSKVLGVPAPPLSASATASRTAGSSLRQYCIIALATRGTSPAILTNGAPAADLGSCNIVSNTDMTCHGHDLNAASADAVGTNNGCGRSGTQLPTRVPDPVASLAANIQPGGSSSAASIVSRAAAAPAPGGSGATWNSNRTLASSVTISGDLTLSADVVVTTPSGGSVLYIQNGTLNLNGHKLSTASGSGLTVVFTSTTGSGTTTPGYSAYPTGGGELDLEAPKSGPWAGIAIYTDPRTIGPQNVTYHGNSPTWKITGLVYVPNTRLTVSGAVSKSSNGGACLALIVDALRINGTGSILMRPEDCPTAGVILPTNLVPNGAPALVL